MGRSRPFALGYVEWLLRSTACKHRSISPGGWGHTWQSSMAAGFLGLSAWLVRDDLPPQARAYVAHVVADEADWVSSRGVPYWKDLAGTTPPGRAGNSAAEEAAWDAGHMGLAIQMLAGHPRADAWARKGTQLGVAAYSTRADTLSDERVNGVALHRAAPARRLGQHRPGSPPVAPGPAPLRARSGRLRGMSDDPLARVRAICLALPEATERLSHGSPTFFVRDKKTFVMYLDDHHGDGRLALWVAAPAGIQEEQVEQDPERFFRPPYVGHRGWLGVRLDRDLDWDEVAGIVEDAYCQVAPKKLVALVRA